jgi:putative ABC transport system ATP-binding protein
MQTASAFLQVENVSRSFLSGQQHQHVLRHASFTLQQGETVALLGRSGSGKSTLLNLLAGIDRTDTGSITLAGTELTALQEPHSTLFRRQHIGFIYQSFNLVAGLTAVENVSLMLEMNGSLGATALQQSRDLLGGLGMGEHADKFPAHLSGGEQQRVAIARALIHQPALVLADEPTGNLDAETGQQVLDWLRVVLRENGSTALLVTHSLAVAGSADRILTLDQGHVMERSGEFAW